MFSKINKFLYGVSFLAILSLFSCTDRLEIEPESYVSSDDFYKNEKEVNLAVISVYNSLYDVLDLEWNVTELRTDNTMYRPDGTPESDIDRFNLDHLTLESTNQISNDYYRASYSTIELANNVLENMKVVTDSIKKNQFEGEARFLRAYSYFNLVRLYGPTVIISESITGEEALELDRSPEDEVYDFIINDLKIAKEKLPSSYESSEIGRATKWAAQGILGKAYLTIHNYEAAGAELKPIVEDSPFRLIDNYGDIFDTNNEYNKGILFAVRFQSGNVGLGGAFANYFAPLQSEDNVVKGNGRSYNVPTNSMSEAYDDGDERKDASMSDYWINDNGGRESDKYINKFNSDFDSYNDAGNDWPILRYADIVLMMSEIALEIKGQEQALIYINEVRERAGVPVYKLSDIDSDFAFKLAIEKERRLELAFENQRWFDLVRTGRALTVINQHFKSEFVYNDTEHPQKSADPIEEYQLLLPIPQYEIDLNPNLTQNIGY